MPMVARIAAFIALLIIFSITGVLLPAAGAVDTVSGSQAAEPVLIDRTNVTQSLSFTITINNSTNTLTADLSNLAATGGGVTTTIGSVSATGTDVSATAGQINNSTVHVFTVSDEGQRTGNVTTDITIQYTHNTSALSPADAGRVTVSLDSVDGVTDQTISVPVVYDTDTVSRTPSTDLVFNGTTVYQGEDDLTFVDNDGTEISRESLIKVGGEKSGLALEAEVDTEETSLPGTYAENQGRGSGNFEITLQESRVTTAELQLNGDEVTRIPSGRLGDAVPTVTATWNFPEAEHLEIEITNPDGDDVTDEVLNGSAIFDAQSGTDSIRVELEGEQPGTYTINFKGADSIGGPSYDFTLLESESVAIETASANITRGEYAEFTITDGLNQEYHIVTIDRREFRQDITTTEQLFRNVSETTRIGYALADGTTSAVAGLDTVNATNAAYAYAVLQIDDTEATGQIDTAFLDDTSVNINLHASRTNNSEFDNTPVSAIPIRDDTEVAVREATVTLADVPEQYTPQETVRIAGETSGVDAVRLYAYDEGEWHPIIVDGDRVVSAAGDKFDRTDVDLTAGTGSGNQRLSFPGRYRLGVIDAEAVTPALTAGSGTNGTISSADFAQAASDDQSVSVVVDKLTASVSTYNAQIAETDGAVTVTGRAPGTNDVMITAIDERGSTVVRTVDADGDDFAREDIPLEPLAQGPIQLYVVSPGRDGRIGDRTRLPNGNPATVDGLSEYLATDATGDGKQVQDRLLSATTRPNASDDQVVSRTFRLTDAMISITRVGPANQSTAGMTPVSRGERLVIAGKTNRDPDQTALRVELTTAAGTPIVTDTLPKWETDGTYSTAFDTSGISPGTYTFVVSDGETTDRVTSRFVKPPNSTTVEPTQENTTRASRDSSPTANASLETPTQTSNGTLQESSSNQTNVHQPSTGLPSTVLAITAAVILILFGFIARLRVE